MILARAVALLLMVAGLASAAAAAPLDEYVKLPAVERAALSSSGARFADLDKRHDQPWDLTLTARR